MGVLARGSVSDRPWGLTFGALGVRGLTGELTVVADGKTFKVAFEGGAIVGAYSPLASDAAVRIALTGNLITSTQVADITRRMAPGRDEIEQLAELARLGPEQAQRLRRRLVANRAARVFSMQKGDFTVEDTFTLDIVPGSELDIRAVCYLGAKNNFSEERMGAELDALGGWFQLKPEAVEDLMQYGFTDAEKPALQMLLEGADLVAIEEGVPNLGARGVRAVVYALVSCGACEIAQTSRPRAAPAPAARTPGQPAPAMRPPGQPAPAQRPPGQPAPAQRPPGQPAPQAVPRPVVGQPGSAGIPRPQVAQPGSGAVRAPMGQSGSGAVRAPMGQSGSGAVRAPAARPPTSPGYDERAATQDDSGAPPVRMRPPTGQPPMPTTPLPEQRTRKPSTPPAARRAKRNSSAALEVEQLLQSKVPLLDRHADHFTVLGLPPTASAEEIRKTYFDLARKLHPDRLAAIGVVDEARNAQRLMAQINAAFAVLNDANKRAEYVSMLSRGGEAAVRAQDAQADEMAMKIMRAEEAFHIGEMALRRDQLAQAVTAFQEAVSLQPNESEYQALLAWAQFAAAPDKNAVASATRRALTKAAEANNKSPTARFYLGRIERMLGKEKEALDHFREVLRIKPNHGEAASEARVLESRLKGKR